MRYPDSVEIEFEWDLEKERENLRKHSVSFQEAATVFGDAFAWTFPDPDHSVGEIRYVTIGISSEGRTLVLSHTDRERRIRIISARQATRRERREYEEG